MLKNKVNSLIIGCILSVGVLTGCSVNGVNDTEKSIQFKKDMKNTNQEETPAPNEKENTATKESTVTKESNLNLKKAKVVRHVDGDTFEAKLDDSGKVEKVRLILVNTPETVKPNSPVEAYGKEASDYTKKNLLDKTVYLQKDVSDTDKYGRYLYYVWVEQPKDLSEKEIRSKMFNAILLKEGYAQIMTIPPNVKYADLFVKLQKEAREGKKGLWSLAEYNK
jgi:micrococcal nuclease